VTRIIAGAARGRRLQVPSGETTRPTSDRVREAMFSTLESMLDLHGCAVLDLFAGSGALGLEALSRGASTATFVERDRRAIAVLRNNIAATRLGPADVHPGDVVRVLRTRSAHPCDLVLLDPPYRAGSADVADALRAALESGWMAAGAVVVVERSTRDEETPWPDGLSTVSHRRYGETTLWYLRRCDDHDTVAE
jgi:16S rRNA (guanine966-N2)-methyltransferase